MKLYSYSVQSHTYVEVKWARLMLTLGGIIIGSLLFFGLAQLNPSFGDTLESRSAKVLSAENDMLRQQLSLISPRVNELERQARQLSRLLNSREIVGDPVQGSRNTAKRIKIQASAPRTASLRP